MILDGSGTKALSSVGWVDHGSIWIYDSGTREVASVAMSDANYLSLVSGQDGFFALVHHWDGRRIRVTVHDSRDPAAVLAAVDVTDWAPRMTGASDVWRSVPPVYLGYLNHDATGAAGYFLLSVTPDGSSLTRMDWFDDDRYDHMYQGIVSVTPLPASNALLFGVQRSSDLVVWDPDADRVLRRMSLGDRGGNPHPEIVGSAEAWANDYDTVVKFDPSSWQITASLLAQSPDDRGKRMFVGSLWVDHAGGSVLVPRPGQGDVWVIRRSDLAVIEAAEVGGQPLLAVRMADGTIVARDWKSGGLLTGMPGNGNRA